MASQIPETERPSDGVVYRVVRDHEEKKVSSSTEKQEIDAALQGAVNDVRSAGYEVTRDMRDFAKSQANLGKNLTMREHMYKVLLREVAIQSAMQEASQQSNSSITQMNRWGKLGEARLACAGANGDYDAMYASALRYFNIGQSVYVTVVNGYKQLGVDISLSFSTLSGDAFEIVVSRDTTVGEVMRLVQQARVQTSSLGTVSAVKLVGPGGTIFPGHQEIKAALDLESEVLLDEQGVFYPLSVLTGEKWREMGLPAQTRWKHLRENEFRSLFGMSKSNFEQLPIWKQTPLKKKHGLF